MSLTDFLQHASTDEIVYHRLAPLAYERVDPQRQAMLREHVARAAARDLVMGRLLLEVAEHAEDLPMLVIKGAATGTTLYGDGALRPREDVDVWVDGWRAAAKLAGRLEAAGFRTVHQLPGTTARHAIALVRRATEQVDVHAVCARRRRIALAIDFHGAWQRRAKFAVDGVELSTLGDAHTFILGATHLSGHHAGQLAPLVLVEDLRRTALRLDDGDWYDVWARCRAHGLLSALAHAVDLLDRWAPSTVPAALITALRDCSDESARFADPTLAMLDDLELLDPQESWAYIGELLYPPSHYLERHFGIARPRPRALLAGWRVVRGVVARLSNGGHNR